MSHTTTQLYPGIFDIDHISIYRVAASGKIFLLPHGEMIIENEQGTQGLQEQLFLLEILNTSKEFFLEEREGNMLALLHQAETRYRLVQRLV